MPTDDLCNYIENKANQNEGQIANPRMNSLGPKQSVSAQILAAQKTKKRTGQSMSIEDQESRRLEKQIMDDISKFD